LDRPQRVLLARVAVGRSVFDLWVMTKFERSAGVIVYRVEAGKRLYLLLDYGKHWEYPKGHIENGEDEKAAALRELAEETGISDARLSDEFRRQINYFFRDKHKNLIRKEVVFFVAETETSEVKLSHEHVDYDFLPLEDAKRKLSFKSSRQLLEAADAYLNNGDELSRPR
jgi:bis(5'-nucleosidyl)-tetraphosphatase